MRRPFRIFFLLTSSLLCVVLISLWLISYSFGIDFRWAPANALYRAGIIVNSQEGLLIVSMSLTDLRPLGRTAVWQGFATGSPPSMGKNRVRGIQWQYLWTFHFEYFHTPLSPDGIWPPARGFIVRVPHWPFVLLFAIAPVCWLSRAGRRCQQFRISKGLCPCCGYDLRASVERCPECATRATITPHG